MHWMQLIAQLHDNITTGTVKPSPWADIDSLCEAVGVDSYRISTSDEIQQAIQEYYVIDWICTDTRVGLSVYILFGEVVAVTSQPARKSSKVVQFISTETYLKVRTFLQSFLSEDDVDVVDLYVDLDPGWLDHNPGYW
jgi:hypothetical protein